MSTRTATRDVLAIGPWAGLASVFLTFGRWMACNRDPAPYGNAWTEDHNGYCSHSSLDALTARPGIGTLLALGLLAVTALWPATVVAVGALVAAHRRDPRVHRPVWWLALFGSLAVVAFFVMWGHVTIVGGGGV